MSDLRLLSPQQQAAEIMLRQKSVPDNLPSLICSDDSVIVITLAHAAMPHRLARAVTGDRPTQAVPVHMPPVVHVMSHVQPATAMFHAHVHPTPVSNAAHAAHQAHIGTKININTPSNAAAELSAALQQLLNN